MALRGESKVTDMQVLLKYIGWAALGYAVYCALLFALQRHMIFPRGMIAHDRLAPPTSVESFWLTLPGAAVECWYLPPGGGPAKGRRPALVFAHGNAELIDFCLDELQPFTALGIGVLLVEYPGYGRSTGTPSQVTITAAFRQAYDWLTARPEVDPSKIVLYGRSLGGGAVCALAAERPAAALILASTFTSIRVMASRYLVPGFLVRDPFDNLAVVRDFDGPLLVLHGRHDDIIPFSHAASLHRAARRSRLLAYDCGHNDCPPERFREDIAGFLREANLID